MCLILCDPMDCNPSGSSVHGILQARILEWVAMPFSRGSSQFRDRTQVSSTAGRFFTVWATREDQEYWSWPQELNRGLLLLRWILYQLSYQGRVNESRSVMSDSLKPHGLYNPGNLQAKILGSRSLLQGIFPTRGLNPGLPHCRQILYQLTHQENPIGYVF